MSAEEKSIGVTNQQSQPDTGFTYKSNHIFKPIPPSTVDLLFFKKLYVTLKESTDDSANQDIAKLKQTPGQSQEDFEKAKEFAKGFYKVTIHIYGSRGEYIFTEDPNIFDNSGLPDKIDRVIFENSTRFKTSLQREPVNQFRITFDFASPPIFNFNISPSLATPTNSSIDIIGENETWVSGTYRKVSNLLEDRRTKHGWLHKNNIWDLFLWIIIMPIIFRLLYLLQKNLPAFISTVSGVLKAAIYVYVFILLLNLFRIVFSYARWVFPYLELSTPLRRNKLHRVILGAILISIISSISYELIIASAKAFWGK